MHPVLAIHGGAGTIPRDTMSEAEYRAARAGLHEALRAGWAVLDRGGAAIDAVQAAVLSLEDCPSFNAGHGAVLNAAGVHQLDAAIMDGKTLAAGAVAGVTNIANPILAAREVLDAGDAVLLIGEGAERFAARQGLRLVPQSYFTTPQRLAHLEKAREAAAGQLGRERTEAEKHGTVGAVARDADGNLAAATSTGGYTNKPEGRVGDTPVFGAGTYARNGRCAVSCTGLGEAFIRFGTAGDIAARIAYLGSGLAAAAYAAFGDLAALGVRGGLVAVGAGGEAILPFTTDGMYRGAIDADGPRVGIHADDFGPL